MPHKEKELYALPKVRLEKPSANGACSNGTQGMPCREKVLFALPRVPFPNRLHVMCSYACHFTGVYLALCIELIKHFIKNNIFIEKKTFYLQNLKIQKKWKHLTSEISI